MVLKPLLLPFWYFLGSMMANNAQYHHMSIHDEKIWSLQMKRAKSIPLGEEEGSPSTESVQSLCILCGQYDITENLCAAGALHATKSKLNEHHVAQLTNKWREMAIYVVDDVLSSRLVIGELGANSAFYHRGCATDLYNRYTKNVMSVKNEIDIDQVKEAAYDVIAFITETLNKAESGFDLQELERLYLRDPS